MSSYTRQQLEAWLKTITVKDDSLVLDIGGSQKPVLGRLATPVSAERYKILDLESPHETERKPDIIWDLNKHLSSMARIDFLEYENKFDVVFCLEVMEYLWNPVRAFDTIHYFMKRGGALFVSSPFLYPVHNPYQQDYLRYTEAGMKKILTETGFDVVDVQSRGMKYPEMWQAFGNAEGMKPSREFESHDSVGHLICATKR